MVRDVRGMTPLLLSNHHTGYSVHVACIRDEALRPSRSGLSLHVRIIKGGL